MLTTYPEKELLQKVQAGDQAAFRILFDQYRQRIYSLAMHLTRSETLSEEIVQDVFLKIWLNRAGLTEIIYFNAYLRVAARNTATNYLRKLARERLALQEITRQAEGADRTTEDSFLDKEYRQILEEAIRSLSPRQEQVYRMSRQQGLKNEEIARQLDLSIHTVKEHLKLAMRTVLTQLEARIEFMVLAAIAFYLG